MGYRCRSLNKRAKSLRPKKRTPSGGALGAPDSHCVKLRLVDRSAGVSGGMGRLPDRPNVLTLSRRCRPTPLYDGGRRVYVGIGHAQPCNRIIHRSSIDRSCARAVQSRRVRMSRPRLAFCGCPAGGYVACTNVLDAPSFPLSDVTQRSMDRSDAFILPPVNKWLTGWSGK
jgi:hypothetical protein